jgi:thiol-disulfide isomerase/thioredoxin
VNRHGLVLVAVALVSMLGGVLLYDFLQPGDPDDSDSPAQAPVELHSIPLTDLDKRQTVLRDWQRQLLVVNFWAPWCAPCRREIPALIQVQEEYRSRGVAILGIAFDNELQVRRFADEYNINYPLFLSSNRAAMYNAALGNPSGSLPFTALLDRELRIIYRHNGELTLDELRAQLEQHL